MQWCTPIAGSTQCHGLSFRANVTINGNYYPDVTFEINGGISNFTIDNLVYCYGDSVGDLHVTAKDGVGVLNINLQRINADGNYLSTWSDNVIQSSDDFANVLLEKANVALVPGSGFGIDTHVRLSYATSQENITKGLDRIEQFLKQG